MERKIVAAVVLFHNLLMPHSLCFLMNRRSQIISILQRGLSIFVDDSKILHVNNKDAVTQEIKDLEQRFGKVTITREK